MSITIAGYTFQGPYSSTSNLQNRSGVYVILCKKGNGSSSVTDVGESSEVKDRVENHGRQPCWRRNCHSSLNFAVLYTPNLQQIGRKKIEQKIRDHYDPPCGEE